MAENEYLVPLGIDASAFAKELQGLRKDVTDLQALVGKSATAMGEAFTAAGQATNKMTSDTVKGVKQVETETAALTKAAAPLQQAFNNITPAGVNRVTTAIASARTQLRNLNNEINNLKLADPSNPRINELTQQAGHLQETINLTHKSIALVGSDTSGIDAGLQAVGALAGGFAVAQGAAALFGDKNEEVQQALLKVTAAMSILQGLQAVGNVLDKESALNQKLRLLLTGEQAGATAVQAAATEAETVVTGEAVVAQEALNAAMLANPVGVLLLVIGGLVAGYELYTHTIGKASDAEALRATEIKAMADAQDKAAQKTAEEEGHLNILVAALKDETATREQKQKTIDELRTTYPEYLSSLTLENALTGQSTVLIGNQIELIKKRALQQAAEDIYKEQLKDVVKAQAEVIESTKNLAEAQHKLNVEGEGEGQGADNRQAFDQATARLAVSTEHLADATKNANGYFNVAVDIQHDLTKTMAGSTGQADNFVTSITDAANATNLYSFALKNVPQITLPNGPINPNLPKPVFDAAIFDKEKADANALAQYKIDLAGKGTAAEISAKREQLTVAYQQDLKDVRLTDTQKLALEGKYTADIRALNLQSIALNYKDRIAAEQALSSFIAAFGDKSSNEYWNARKAAAIDGSKQALAQEGITAGEIKNINTKLKVDLANIDIERRKGELDRQSDVIATGLAMVEEGSKAEEALKVAQFGIQRDAELNVLNITDEAKARINAEFDKKVTDTHISYAEKFAQRDVQIAEDAIKVKLAGVQAGSEEELKLKNDLVNEEARLQLANTAGIKNEVLRLAEIKRINAEANRQQLDNTKAFYQAQLQLQQSYDQSLLSVNDSFLKTIVDDTSKSDKERFNAKQQIIKNEIAAIDKQLADEKKLFDEGVINYAAYLTAINNLNASKNGLTQEFANNAKNFVPTFSLRDAIVKGIFGDQSDSAATKALVNNFTSIISDAYDQLTKSIENKAQRQIDAIQLVINATQTQIDQQQSAVDQQKSLSDKGLANDLKNQQKKLNDLKAKKDEEIKAQQDAQKKLQDIRKVEAAIQAATIVANNIETASNMVKAASSIFGSFAKIPFGVGIAIAVGVIASMVASFLAIKNAFSAATVDNTPKFRKGGGLRLNGPSHEGGGLGLYDESTGQKKAEYEGGEYLFAINGKNTRKYLPLLEAINTGRIADMDAILNTGRLPMEQVQQLIIVNRENEDAQIANGGFWGNAKLDNLVHLAEINKGIKALNTPKKEVTDMGDYVIEREGNRTRKIWKRR